MFWNRCSNELKELKDKYSELNRIEYRNRVNYNKTKDSLDKTIRNLKKEKDFIMRFVSQENYSIINKYAELLEREDMEVMTDMLELIVSRKENN